MTNSKSVESIQISAPNIQRVNLRIVGTAPYVQNRFANKAREMMMAKMAAGSTAKGKKVREARDFNDDCQGALHIGVDGRCGIPAAAFRVAMVGACRLVGFKMTLAKMSIFVEADTFDCVDGMPLVHINGDWERLDMHTRNATGVIDMRIRPMWREWNATVCIRFDADQFTATDVTNLLLRVGEQVGIGEGRADSKQSCGLGFGHFTIEGAD